MAIREGAWDCPSCGQKGNPGSAKCCGGCGTVRGDGVPFYLPEGAREVTEAEELRRANAGPDWKCPYCGGDNPGSNSHCSGCGTAQDGMEKRQTRNILDKGPAKPPEPEKPSWLKRIAVGCCLMILLFFVGCWVLNQESAVPAKVESLSWKRTVAVEQLGKVVEEGWQGKGEVPAGARVLSRSKQVREHRQVQTGSVSRTRTSTERVQTGTEKVKVGVKDMGNGYFEDIYEEQPVYSDKSVEEDYQEPIYRDEPVYDTKVSYEVEKWHTDHVEEAHGNDNKPYWPEVRTNRKQRAGEKTEVYTVGLKGDGSSYTYSPPTEAEFIRLSAGQTVEASISRMGIVGEVHPK